MPIHEIILAEMSRQLVLLETIPLRTHIVFHEFDINMPDWQQVTFMPKAQIMINKNYK